MTTLVIIIEKRIYIKGGIGLASYKRKKDKGDLSWPRKLLFELTCS